MRQLAFGRRRNEKHGKEDQEKNEKENRSFKQNIQN